MTARVFHELIYIDDDGHEMGHRMTTVRFAFLASAWTAAALGILQLRNISFEHALCLPGRCGPPLGALLSIQLFWLLGAVTIAAVMLILLPKRLLRRIGLVLALAAVIGMAIVIGVDYTRWPRSEQPFATPALATWGYQFRRFIFPIVTMTDVPWLQTALAGITMLFVGRDRGSQHQARPQLEDAATVQHQKN